jgi:putative sterol carrier protein
MKGATESFLENLGERGHEPLLEKTTGTVRLELENGKQVERWLVTVDKGDIAVSHKQARADCTIRARKELFDGIASGEVNAMAAVLRGAVGVEGSWELLVLFQRLFPGPSNVRAGAQPGAGKKKR